MTLEVLIKIVRRIDPSLNNISVRELIKTLIESTLISENEFEPEKKPPQIVPEAIITNENAFSELRGRRRKPAREELKEYYETEGRSMRSIAKEMGTHEVMVAGWIRGKWTPNVKSETKIRKFLDTHAKS